MNTKVLTVLGLGILVAGCQTTAQITGRVAAAGNEYCATAGAIRDELPGRTAQVLSREQVPPVLQFRGTPRLEYTIGVSGCGQRGTYLVICPEDGSGCFAAAGRRE